MFDGRIDYPDSHYALALGDVCDAWRALKPPTRMSVSEGARRNLVMKRPGEAGVPWTSTDTAYMVKPMDTLASRIYAGLCFVGPAQSGKTAGLGEGWIAHNIANDPGDMLVVQMTEGKAREYSKQRIERALKASPNLAALMGRLARDDNTHDKSFKHGMWLRIAWPTETNFSSTAYRYVFQTDYDRYPDDIDGAGSGWVLGSKRTTTYLSRGMCAIESSPGRPFEDPNWQPATAHEAPPTTGILGVYNTSDRQRWYWQCRDCREHFEAAPGVGLFHLPPEQQLLEEVRTANLVSLARHHGRVVCPHCGNPIDFKWRHEMNSRGIWLLDGQRIDRDGHISGEALQSTIAGFWLGGVAAAYQSWESLLSKHLQGLREYAMTGSETSLQAAVNTDQGMPYMPRHLVEARGANKSPAERADKTLERYICPAETRTVIVSVDVQGGINSRFVLQAHAVGPNLEQWLVNRWEIRLSARPGMGAEFAPIDPAKYAEDWDVLTEKVVRSTYRTALDDLEIRVRLVVVDSGGEAGVTDNAYAWWRRLRKAGYGTRVRLYKGASAPNAPLLKETMVGGRRPGEKGDVPLLSCNPNLLSDAVDNGVKREGNGPNAIHFPTWLPPAFHDEMGAEVRGKNGVWKQIRKRNEAPDLCRMVRAGCVYLGLDKIKDWGKVPAWLKPLAENSECIPAEERRAIQANVVVASSEPIISDAPKRQRRPRRAATSSYL